MNRRSVKKQTAKARPRGVASKAVSRRVSAKAGPAPAPVQAAVPIALPSVAHQIAPRNSVLRAHKFRVGQTVLYTSSPITRPGASGTYKVVKLLPSDGDDYQYRIKNAGEAFERVAKESQLELEH
jgi:hypothetical protein